MKKIDNKYLMDSCSTQTVPVCGMSIKVHEQNGLRTRSLLVGENPACVMSSGLISSRAAD